MLDLPAMPAYRTGGIATFAAWRGYELIPDPGDDWTPTEVRLPTREEVLGRAKPLPPYEEMVIEGLTGNGPRCRLVSRFSRT